MGNMHIKGNGVPLISRTDSIQEGDDEVVPPTENEMGSERHLLGTFDGVFVPSVLSMFSIVLFLRLGWQAGVLLTLLMFVLGYIVVTSTMFSIAAITTNGEMGVGGAYYMISRSLGPEFGGAIGLIFFFANLSASILYLVGFVDALTDAFSLPDTYTWKLFLGSCGLFVLLIICLVGADMFAKSTIVFFVIVLSTLAFGIISLFAQAPGYIEGFTGWNLQTFNDNLAPGYTFDPLSKVNFSFASVFAIFFPAVTGALAGANLSGDLKNPARSIPTGSIYACIFTFVVYVLLIIVFGGSSTRSILTSNYFVMNDVSFAPIVVSIGIFAATLSSALSGILGSSRVLQSLAKDKIIPGLDYFAKGTKGEPRRAVLMCWFIVQCGLLIGKVDAVSPISTMFYLLSYTVVNFACFAVWIVGAPNFRPLFKYYHWSVSLLGLVSSLGLMFYCRPLETAISVLAMIVLLVIIHYRAPATSWGDIGQALMYHQVRKYLLRLDIRKEHLKFWRPQMILLVPPNARSYLPLIDFVNNVKKGGLYVLGTVLVGSAYDVGGQALAIQRLFFEFIQSMKLKAFFEVIMARSFREGVQNLLLGAGLGSMKPNTVVIGFPESIFEPIPHGPRYRASSISVPGAAITHKPRDLSSVGEGEVDSLYPQTPHPGLGSVMPLYQGLRDSESSIPSSPHLSGNSGRILFETDSKGKSIRRPVLDMFMGKSDAATTELGNKSDKLMVELSGELSKRNRSKGKKSTDFDVDAKFDISPPVHRNVRYSTFKTSIPLWARMRIEVLRKYGSQKFDSKLKKLQNAESYPWRKRALKGSSILDRLPSYFSGSAQRFSDVVEYVDVLRDSLVFGKHFLICRNFDRMDKDYISWTSRGELSYTPASFPVDMLPIPNLSVSIGKHDVKSDTVLSRLQSLLPRHHAAKKEVISYGAVPNISVQLPVAEFPLDVKPVALGKMTIDVWPFLDSSTDEDGATSTLTVLLAHILSLTDVWQSHARLRVISYVDLDMPQPSDTAFLNVTEWHDHLVDTEYQRLEDLLKVCRVFAEPVVVTTQISATHNPIGEKDDPCYPYLFKNSVILSQASHTALIFLSCPESPPSVQDNALAASDCIDRDAEYLQKLELGTRFLPPCIIVRGCSVVVTQEI